MTPRDPGSHTVMHAGPECLPIFSDVYIVISTGSYHTGSRNLSQPFYSINTLIFFYHFQIRQLSGMSVSGNEVVIHR